MTIGERLKEAGVVRRALGGFSDEHIIEGTTTAEERASHAAQVRRARVETARRNSRWHEVSETALVARGRGWLVEADSDVLLRPARGIVFEPQSANVVADMTELWFTVSDEGVLAFYELVPGVPTWTHYLEQRAERERRRNAPRPRMRVRS